MCILLLYTVSIEEYTRVKLASPKGSKKSLGYLVGFVLGAIVYGMPAKWPVASVTFLNCLLNSLWGSACILLCGVFGLIACNVEHPVQVGVLPLLPGALLKSCAAVFIFLQIRWHPRRVDAHTSVESPMASVGPLMEDSHCTST